MASQPEPESELVEVDVAAGRDRTSEVERAMPFLLPAPEHPIAELIPPRQGSGIWVLKPDSPAPQRHGRDRQLER